MNEIAQSLQEAQRKAEALFAEVAGSGMIRGGKLESELSTEIHALAKARFGLRRHWHKRLVRSGENTLLTYYDEALDRRMQDDDIVYLDFGPVFEAWEADFGRTYAIGADPLKHKLVDDIAAAFRRGKDLYQNTPTLTTGALYDYVAGLAAPAGWEFGAPTAGHLIGHFPHERMVSDPSRFSIRSGNDLPLREPDENGRLRHWILEIHFVDRARKIRGFFEELLTA
ncbi:MAG TPA: M24 family metallopeptidase [Steroidobacteraceae bacterium]|nr:M24 family metallopeptidase [Steroidobacteraceae bacterium]